MADLDRLRYHGRRGELEVNGRVVAIVDCQRMARVASVMLEGGQSSLRRRELDKMSRIRSRSPAFFSLRFLGDDTAIHVVKGELTGEQR